MFAAGRYLPHPEECIIAYKLFFVSAPQHIGAYACCDICYCPPVSPSVCLSVTRVYMYQSRTVEVRIMQIFTIR